ncbi:MAG: hypothetical protein LBK53_06615 [Heliobacteriaceae bacterium]|jgi:hypothetical protein|nr:hypothetical protein [Heliobacteriaceae bacterium]
MSFLASDSQKVFFAMQRSQLKFEQGLVMNRAQMLTKQMDSYSASKSNDDNWDAEKDSYFLGLQQQEEFLETRSDNLDSQVALLDQAIDSLKNLVKNGIKDSCALNLMGG